MIYTIAIFTVLLLAIALVDIKSRLIPNIWLLIAAMVALPIVISMEYLLPGILGACVGFGSLSLLYLAAPSKVGAGDVKLAGLIGFMVGYPMVFLSLLLAGSIGAFALIALVALKRIKVSESIPYAPFLCSGAIISLWAGNWIINWYWGLF